MISELNMEKEGNNTIAAAKPVADTESFFVTALDLGLNLIFIVLLALFIRFFIVSPFKVDGPSMCSTLNVIDGECQMADSGENEIIIVNEIGYERINDALFGEPKMGDIVVFQPPGSIDESEFYVKRIIGLPGDNIKIVDGKVYKLFNDEYEEIDESSYLNERNLGATFVQGVDKSEEVVYQVPEGYYFVLGDNRIMSSDSRSCFHSRKCSSKNINSYVPLESIKGEAELVFWPLKNIRILDKVEY